MGRLQVFAADDQHPHSPDTTKEDHMTTWKDVHTSTIDVDGVPFVYRELGADSEVPVVCLHHFTAVLDDWDPRVIDGSAAQHRVIAFDNKGVGGTGGSVPADLEQMGADAITFIRALGHDKQPASRSSRCSPRGLAGPARAHQSSGVAPAIAPERRLRLNSPQAAR